MLLEKNVEKMKGIAYWGDDTHSACPVLGQSGQDSKERFEQTRKSPLLCNPHVGVSKPAQKNQRKVLQHKQQDYHILFEKNYIKDAKEASYTCICFTTL